MTNQDFVISPYNPLISLHPVIEKIVFEEFFKPIFVEFFSLKGGIDSFQEFDFKKLKTEIEYKNELNYVNNYLYSEIMSCVHRMEDGKIFFKPRYSISFDSELTDCDIKSGILYPYQKIFRDGLIIETEIRYGVMSLGKEPVLYIIYIELQHLINFIKKINIDNIYSSIY